MPADVIQHILLFDGGHTPAAAGDVAAQRMARPQHAVDKLFDTRRGVVETHINFFEYHLPFFFDVAGIET